LGLIKLLEFFMVCGHGEEDYSFHIVPCNVTKVYNKFSKLKKLSESVPEIPKISQLFKKTCKNPIFIFSQSNLDNKPQSKFGSIEEFLLFFYGEHLLFPYWALNT
jgi:hypothetical protein